MVFWHVMISMYHWEHTILPVPSTQDEKHPAGVARKQALVWHPAMVHAPDVPLFYHAPLVLPPWTSHNLCQRLGEWIRGQGNDDCQWVFYSGEVGD